MTKEAIDTVPDPKLDDLLDKLDMFGLSLHERDKTRIAIHTYVSTVRRDEREKVNQWQPIETMPKEIKVNGTTVMLLFQNSWNYADSGVDFGVWGYIEMDEFSGQAIYGWKTNTAKDEDPTHWMSLPPSPEHGANG